MDKGRYELKGYTYCGTGLGNPCENIEKLRKKGLMGLAITDVNTVAGWLDGISSEKSFRFFYGIDVRLQKTAYTFDDSEGYIEDEDNYHAEATILIKDEQGRKNLLDMLYECSSRARNQYPVIELDVLKKHRKGLLVGYSCNNNVLTKKELDIQQELAESVITRTLDIFDYVEVAPADYNPLYPFIDLRKREYVQEYTQEIIRFAEEHGKPVIAVSGFNYRDSEDEWYWRILQCDGQISASEGHHIVEYGMMAHLRSTEELLEEFSYLGIEEAKKIVIDNTIRIAEKIDDFDPLDIPDCHISWVGANDSLQSRVYERVDEKYDDTRLTAIKRIEEELEWITEHGLAELLLMFSDTIDKNSIKNWDHSAYGVLGNSVVAYVLGITEVDPIEYDLPFSLFKIATEKEGSLISICIPQSQREKYIFGLSQADGVATIVSGTEAFHYNRKQLCGMIDEYERISGKRLAPKVRENTIAFLSGMPSSNRYNTIPYFIVPNGKESFIDRRWTGSSLSSDFIGHSSINRNYSYFEIASNDITDILFMLEKETGIPVSSLDVCDASPLSVFEYDPESRMPKWTAGIYPKKYTDSILKFGINSFEDMVRIEGFACGKGTWDSIQLSLIENCVIPTEDLITNREDIYDLLVRAGIDELQAVEITDRISSGYGIGDNDIVLLQSCGVSELSTHILKHILYLPMRSDCIRMAQEKFWLAYYKTYHPEEFYRSYIGCIADDREISIIKGGNNILRDTLSLLKDYGDPSSHEQADWSDFEMSARALVVAEEMYSRGYSYD